MSIYERIPASPEEVEAFGKGLTEAYLHCRVWGHDPQPHNIVVAKDVEGVPNAYWDADLICSHGCGVRWRVLVGRDGELLRRRLDYKGAPGYLSDTGWIDREGKKVLRSQFFTGRTKKPSRKKPSRKKASR